MGGEGLGSLVQELVEKASEQVENVKDHIEEAAKTVTEAITGGKASEQAEDVVAKTVTESTKGGDEVAAVKTDGTIDTTEAKKEVSPVTNPMDIVVEHNSAPAAANCWRCC